MQQQLLPEKRGVRIREKSSLADTKASVWRSCSRRCSRHWERYSSAAPGQTMVRQLWPCSSGRSTEDSQARPGCLKQTVTPWEANTAAGFWQDLWPHGEKSLHWSRFAAWTCDRARNLWRLFLSECTMEGTHAGALNEEPQPMERTSTGAVWEGLLREVPHWNRGAVWWVLPWRG